MLAFTFPGQGSQKPGMGAAWVDHPAWIRVKQAEEATGRDVARLLLEADQAELTETQNAQLATFVLSIVVHDAATAQGAKPAVYAGHSLGEYSALVAAGVLSFEDGCRLVLERGEAMKAAAALQPGTMYAVLGLDDDQVDVACRRADGDAWVANYNSNGQVIISGSLEALERAGAIAKELGAKRAMGIPVGGAFHTPYMAPARDRLREAIRQVTFHEALAPVIANVDAMAHTDGGEWPEILSAQLCSPVRWRQSTQTIVDQGATILVELGPGSVLTGLAKRNAPDTTYLSVSDPEHLDNLRNALAKIDEVRERMINLDEPLEPQGEHLHTNERLVVSTTTGLFDFDSAKKANDAVIAGDVVARVGDQDIVTPFTGTVMKVMAISGERITVGQPVIWMTEDEAN